MQTVNKPKLRSVVRAVTPKEIAQWVVSETRKKVGDKFDFKKEIDALKESEEAQVELKRNLIRLFCSMRHVEKILEKFPKGTSFNYMEVSVPEFMDEVISNIISNQDIE